jgi:hypothetical protein
VSGNTLKGKSSVERDGETWTRDWEAKRAKEKALLPSSRAFPGWEGAGAAFPFLPRPTSRRTVPSSFDKKTQTGLDLGSRKAKP